LTASHILTAELAAGLDELKLPLPSTAVERLLAFQALLAKWNRVYNLVADADPDILLRRHLLDSLAAVPYISGPRVIDVGTGAGLPGIPLAIALPEVQFTLLDAIAKKTRFVRQVVQELGLKNVDVVHSRVEPFQPETGFDTVITRAYAAISDMLAQTRHLCRPGTRVVALKGEYPADELAALPQGFRVEATPSLCVPGLQATRHVIIMVAEAGG
jgi:16S rRNA (guanine527-N7)-methyltransferase